MAVDTQQLMQEAEKLGRLVAQHPAVARYKSAQKAVADDAEAGRMLADMERQIESLSRQEQSGLPITDAQRAALESAQSRVVSHIKIKNWNMAQVEFIDLLRKITQTIQRQLGDQAAPGAGDGGSSSGAAAPVGADISDAT
jgi:cell fate (sporulation/competence/biofilm development) regulator YlbF (YheA/YmcA/DUF963 family)